MSEASDAPPIGVLLLNMGGPSTLDEVEPFLYQLFADPMLIELPLGALYQERLARFISVRRARRVRGLYASIGGGSPILKITQAQALAVQGALRERGVPAHAFVAMRYAAPRVDEAVAEAVAAGCRRFVLLSLYPQYARATSGSSFVDARRALMAAGQGAAQTAVVRSYPLAKRFVTAYARRLRAALDALPEERRTEARVLFSAHALPIAYVLRGDPYLCEIVASARAVAAEAGVAWGLCEVTWQSQTGPVPWLGPRTDAMLKTLAGAGTKDVVAVPISFVSEHIETLQEMDLEFAHAARSLGIGWHRVPTVDADPEFVAALADEVVAAIEAPHGSAAEVTP